MKIYNKFLKIVKKNIEGLDYQEALDYLNNKAIPSKKGAVKGLYCYWNIEPLATIHNH